MVVAMLDAERAVVERQWRHPIGKALIEFPAGELEAGEPVLVCAVREFFEETGYRAAEWARAGITHNAIAYATEGIEIWFARGLTAGERRSTTANSSTCSRPPPEELRRRPRPAS